jgi:hypothetical protein
VHLSKGAFMALYEALVSVAMDEAREKWWHGKTKAALKQGTT